MLSIMKTAERELVRKLRRTEGLSVRELAIAAGVSKSSVSLWVRDIQLTEQQFAELRERNPAYNAQRNGAAALAARGRARRAAYQQEGRALVREGHNRFVQACLLYWAEGANARHSLSFSNADAEMVLLWMEFLRTIFRVAENRIRITCYLYSDHLARQAEVENYWLELTRLGIQEIGGFERPAWLE
jgi:transcriptional regulator with XRE-family HTH domain